MKQRKVVSLIGALVLLISAVVTSVQDKIGSLKSL